MRNDNNLLRSKSRESDPAKSQERFKPFMTDISYAHSNNSEHLNDEKGMNRKKS